MIEALGRLPMPDELRSLGRTDPRFFAPDAQFRYERLVEPPVIDEGFAAIESRDFVRQHRIDCSNRAVILEFDDVLCPRDGDRPALHPDEVSIPELHRAALQAFSRAGWFLLAFAWRPQIDNGSVTLAAVHACFQRARDQIGLDIDFACCPHPAGPPVCWCRKPLPGLLLQFAGRQRVALDHSILIGRSAADRTLARRLGLAFHDPDPFFSDSLAIEPGP
jgi:histidinol phosphatase-like enzyme